MYCQNKITHTVQEGDSLYKLARQYRTTVTELILGNPGVNPYNLQIGMQLSVCPGEEFREPGMPEMGTRPGGSMRPEMPGTNAPSETPEQVEDTVRNLMEEMRLAWLSNVYWTRMYLMSVDANTADQQEVFERMLQTADEIVDVFAPYLSVTATRQLQNLLMEHMELTGQLIRILKTGQMSDYDSVIKDWYGNANQIATFLGSQNPFFGSRETRNLLLNHLDMTREEIEYQINGDYGRSIDTFRDIRDQVLEMADYFARGLLAR